MKFGVNVSMKVRTLVNTHNINKCAKLGSILLGVSREDGENIVSHRVSIKF
jgi:hypothetical protein